jgi:hypothetical protein
VCSSDLTLPAISAENKSAFIRVLESRLEDMTASQTARLKKTIRIAANR